MQQAKPYVYKGVHRETGEFYIGFRSANKEPWETDLPKYRTSSKLVRPRFDEFDWQVLMIFEKPECAYDFEQYMIHEAWGDPLLLNKSCYHGKPRFSIAGAVHSAETKDKIRKAATGRTHSAETRIKMGALKTGVKKPERSAETREKLRKANIGKKLSKDHRLKLSEAHVGLKWYTDGVKNVRARNCPDGFYPGVVAKYTKESLEKMSKANLGRKLTSEHRNKISEAVKEARARSDRSGYRWYTNGVKSTLAKEAPPGWRIGKAPQAKPSKDVVAKRGAALSVALQGTKYFNNGIESVRRRECPEGFVPGRLFKSKKTRSNNLLREQHGKK
jgi:hypothetical protein